jgi:hypothetical protein
MLIRVAKATPPQLLNLAIEIYAVLMFISPVTAPHSTAIHQLVADKHALL